MKKIADSGQRTVDSEQLTADNSQRTVKSFSYCLLSPVLCLLSAVCFALVSCDVGDPEHPGTPKDMQFVCDASTAASICTEANTRLLIWTASGDDGDKGQALQYDMKWAYEPMTEAVYANTFPFIDEPAPQPSGSREVLFLPRMYLGVDISFGLKALDEIALESGLAATSVVHLDFVRTPVGPSGVSQPGFGSATVFLGDLNGQGVFDLAVGAPGAVNPANGLATGAVYLYFNASPEYLLTYENGLQRSAGLLEPSVVIYGEAAGDQFGAAMAGEADFNGDGFVDLAIGAPGSGKVYIYFGGWGGQLEFYYRELNPATPFVHDFSSADVAVTSPTTGFGSSVAFLGDMDLRGCSELLVGSPLESRSYLFYGCFYDGNSISGTPPVNMALPAGLCTLPAEGCADWTIIGPAGSDFGKVVARARDIDGGGAEDIVISAPNQALVYIFYGGNWSSKAMDFSLASPQTQDISSGATFDLVIQGEAGSEFGAAISAQRDMSGSEYGNASIAIGAPATDSVYVIYGYPGGVITYPAPANTVHDAITGGADQKVTPEFPPLNYRFGEALTTRADLNGDWWPDLLVGAPDAVGTAGTVGAVYEFLNGAEVPASRYIENPDYIIWGLNNAGRFGASVAGMGDMVPHLEIIYFTFFDDFVAGAPGENAAYAEY